MTKKNDKRLCWNCEGSVSYHLNQCPYCGVDVTKPPARDDASLFKGFASPFQKAPKQDVPQPPYPQPSQSRSSDIAVTQDEWNTALSEPQRQEKRMEDGESEESASPSSYQEMIALLLLLPGVVLFLFGLALAFFSQDGVLTVQWNQSVAYFYILGATPLLYLGWRAFRK